MKLNQTTLLLLALLLAGVKFLFLPLFEQYKEMQYDLEKVTARYEKSEEVIAKQSFYLEQSERYKTALKQLESKFGEPKNPESYELIVQESVQKLLKKYDLHLIKFGWASEFEVLSGDIQKAQLSLNMVGSATGVIYFLTELRQVSEMVVIDSFNISTRGRQEDSTDIGSASATIEFSIWIKAI